MFPKKPLQSVTDCTTVDDMSTNSIIAFANDQKGWLGRYCHWDGYPTHMAKTLWNEVKAAGVDALEVFLTSGPGEWGISQLGAGFLTNPVQKSWDHSGDDGPAHNFQVYKGRPGADPRADWYTPGTDLGGAEWVYIAYPVGLQVNKATGDTTSEFVGLYAWDLPEPDWEQVETQGYNPRALTDPARQTWAGHEHHPPTDTKDTP